MHLPASSRAINLFAKNGRRDGQTCVIVNVQVGGHLDDVPGARLPVVGEVHVVLVVEETEADLVPGEGPGAELHDAGLLVEGEVRHVNCAGGLQRESFKTDILGKNLSCQL